MTTTAAPSRYRNAETRVQIARHMIAADWGIAIFRHENGEFEVATTANMGAGAGLRSHPFAWVRTEAEARAAANKGWKSQTGRSVKQRWIR